MEYLAGAVAIFCLWLATESSWTGKSGKSTVTKTEAIKTEVDDNE